MKFIRSLGLVLGICLPGIITSVVGQNLVANGITIYSVDQIVRKFLFNDSKSLNIDHIKFSGGYGAIGAYDATGTPFGTTSGMVLSTGSIFKINGPYLHDTSCTSWSILLPDYDAERIAHGGIMPDPPMGGPPPPPLTSDPAYIEFDVSSPGNGLTFNFQYGSMEYEDTLCTDTTQDVPRDLFAILIQGKGVGDNVNYVNLATLTEIAVPTPIPPPSPILPWEVPINSYSVNNGPHNAGPCQRCERYNDNGKGGGYSFTSMPGWTNVFTKTVNILPCDTYHVKILISDVGNQCGDSWVFVNVETVDPPVYEVVDKYKVGTASYPVDTVAFEDCDYAELRVERYTNIGAAGTVNLTYTGTALAGTDYQTLPTTINFAPNQRVAVIPIIALQTPANTPDRTIVVHNSNEICGVLKNYAKSYYIRKPVMNFTLGPDTSVCEGVKLLLNATNRPSAEYYVWNDATSGALKTVTTSGQYSVRVRIGTCMKSDTINVNFKPLVKFSLGPDSAICFKDSLKLNPKLSLSDTAIHYTWYDNTSKPTKTVGATGLYWLMVTKYGCSSFDSMNLEVKPLPTVDIGRDTTFCYTGSPFYSIDANTDPMNTLQWSTGANGLSIKVYQSGTYSVKVKGNGCYNYDTIKVNMNQTPPLNLRDTVLCENYSLKLRAPKGFNYLWNNGSNDSVITTTNAGRFSVIAFNGSCIAYDTSNVTRLPSPKVNLGNDTSLCKGQYVNLDATYNGDIVSYQWSGAGNGCGNKPGCMTLSSGNYYVTLTSQTNGCSTKDSLYFFAKPLPAPNLGKDTGICFYQSMTVAPNCTFDSLFWNDGSQNPTYTYDRPGDYWVKVYKDNCSNIDSIKVSISTKSPPFTLSHDTGFCKGKSVSYDLGCTNCTYLWEDNSTLPVRIFKSTGTHIVTIDNQTCKRVDTINVEAIIPASVFPSDTFVCNGIPLVLTNPVPKATVKWYDNTIFDSKTILKAGHYWITLTEKGCKYTDTFNVEHVGAPVVDLGPNISTCSSADIFLDATNRGNTIYNWSNGATTPIIKVDSGGLYKVTVTRCNATATSEVFIDYLSKAMVFYVPSAFTPDENKLNDEFIPKGRIKEPQEYLFTVYNKWGQKVFETTDISKGWDGTNNGNKLSSGVYVWTIDAKSDCYADPYYHDAGNITLLK